MVQFRILTGKMAGAVWSTRRFPVQIGRGSAADLRLEEHGVFDRHLQLELKPREGYAVSVLPPALASLNGASFQSAMLRNGDVLELGSARLQFWLADTRQRSLRLSEWAAWTLIAGVSLGQVFLIYWLLR